nr:DUF1501 domain-containing protein [Verrucomicrobium spinosum]
MSSPKADLYFHEPLPSRKRPPCTRRTFLGQSGLGLGAMALQGMLPGLSSAAPAAGGMSLPENPLLPHQAPLPAKARSVIYLHMSGAPPTLDLFDYKPKLNELHMQDCPDSLFAGKRFASSRGGQRCWAPRTSSNSMGRAVHG